MQARLWEPSFAETHLVLFLLSRPVADQVETGTTPRFKLIDPNHVWKRFNHEKNASFKSRFGLFRQHVY
jgi:hypothetical protein